MLSGIRTGKKKKKQQRTSEPSPAVLGGDEGAIVGQEATSHGGLSVVEQDNRTIADELRNALASGGAVTTTSTKSKTGSSIAEGTKHHASASLEHLERRGRIAKSDGARGASVSASAAGSVIVDTSSGPAGNQKREEDMTVEELAAQERHSKFHNEMSWDEHATRNLVRLGKKRRRKENSENDDYDVDDSKVEQWKKLMPGNEGGPSKRSEKAASKAQERHQHRLMHEGVQQEKVASRCNWWLESSQFAKHRLLALGNHVSLVMAPPAASLVQGHHFYLVPIKHASSFVDCDDMSAVWNEVRMFRRSLQQLYREDKDDSRSGGVVLTEMVSHSNNKGLWQTKLEVVPVARPMLQDAPIYFQSAMREQTEEWGTHNKILSTTASKPLSSVIPNKKNFPYFYVDWGDIDSSSNTGYAQIIESQSVRHDFGLDTLAAMMEMDPIRFQRKRQFSHLLERQGISDFLAKWDKVDWTKELDK